MKWEPRNLEEVMKEVEEFEIKRKRTIDPKIRDLIVGFWRCKIHTEMSCQGHHDGLPFPWVIIYPADVDKALLLCGLWNIQKRPLCESIQWVVLSIILPSGKISIRLLPRCLSEENCPLEELQEDAIRFGKFLQELPELPIIFFEKRPE